ncbi:hypothetical protein UY3_15117 [Chelonia mydas]|uniref:Uncharacterized protein n=1 Tax=Chelonia mydas TaxID=8469 RepID=M7B6J5_CHEMY|nr:hypothetical protein UY3_15117 [Chelonia mydas]
MQMLGPVDGAPGCVVSQDDDRLRLVQLHMVLELPHEKRERQPSQAPLNDPWLQWPINSESGKRKIKLDQAGLPHTDPTQHRTASPIGSIQLLR